tara:strand:+ start:4430 stop:4579 length:150 start_codon:yes stop_codon:yes gene_type:complete
LSEIKKNQNLILVVVVLLMATPIYNWQYRKIYKNPSKVKELSTEAVFFD